MQFTFTNKGTTARSPVEQAAIAVRILDERHVQDVYTRARAALGERTHVIGQIDLSRNVLSSRVNRLSRAYLTPPLVDDLTPELAALIGDESSRTTIDRYASAGGRPMPTALALASQEALRYRLGAGFAGLLLGWSDREARITIDVVTPDAMTLTYAPESPMEPVVIAHRGIREVDGQARDIVDEYDLRDEAAPRYRVLLGGEDVTEQALGRSYTGEEYPWRYSDGRPFHRVAITGHPRYVYRTNALVEATLIVASRWTAWGAAVDDAGFPQRNVRGLQLDHQDSDAESGQTGVATGPETILQWRDTDPERPGDHWQDGPGYDPDVIARAIRTYETTVESALDLPVSLEATGGEPTETEQRALAELIATTYPECRRFASECLRRCAAIATRDAGAGTFRDTPYATLFREEVETAIAGAVAAAGGKAADTALNGAQVVAAQGIVVAVAQGALPRDAGIGMLQTFFRLTPDEAERVFASVGTARFTPTPGSE